METEAINQFNLFNFIIYPYTGMLFKEGVNYTKV